MLLSACSFDSHRPLSDLGPHSDTNQICSRISWHLCNFYSAEELRDSFIKMFHSQNSDNEPITSRYCNIYDVTNGAARFVFVQVPNGPQNVPMFSLFCYQRIDSSFVLKNYIPVSEFWYRDVLGSNLELLTPTNLVVFTEGEYVKVSYRSRTLVVMSTNLTF